MAMTKHHDKKQFWEARDYYSLQLKPIMKEVNFKSLTQRNTQVASFGVQKYVVLNTSIHRKLNSHIQHRTEK